MSAADATAPVTAVVISYFTGPVLARALASLAAQREIGEIVLIDNGNFNGDVASAVAAAGPNAPPIRVFSGHGNIGFAAACNLGARNAAGDFLLFFNPDAVAPSGAVAQMMRDGEALARPWLMGVRLVGPDGAEQQGSRRRVLTPWLAFVEISRLYRLAPEHPYFRRFNLHTDKMPEEVTETPAISGAVMFLHRADFDAIGGMDEHYFLHVEDLDFCLRFAKEGGTVWFNPHVAVTHYKSSSRANPVRIEMLKTSGVIRYFHTHFSHAYPRPFLWLVDGALWTGFGLLAAKRAVAKAMRLIGFARRAGGAGLKRALSLGRRQSGR